MPEMQGLHAGRVWHVPLLQGHEEVWRAWPHEAVLCPPAVLGGESKLDSWLLLHGSGSRGGKEEGCPTMLWCQPWFPL